MIDPVDPLMMRDRSDDDGNEFTLLDLPASLRTGGGDGDTVIGRAAMVCNLMIETLQNQTTDEKDYCMNEIKMVSF